MGLEFERNELRYAQCSDEATLYVEEESLTMREALESCITGHFFTNQPMLESILNQIDEAAVPGGITTVPLE